jgi:hypothetical protein
MSDMAKELRERSLRAEQEGEPLALLDDAADEIDRLRLTDEERAAIALAKSRLGTSDGDWQADDVLAALLERLG